MCTEAAEPSEKTDQYSLNIASVSSALLEAFRTVRALEYGLMRYVSPKCSPEN